VSHKTNCISHSQNFVSCSRVIKLCAAVTCRPNIVFYSDQSVYKYCVLIIIIKLMVILV
jgi:hypothetical protein